MYTLTLKNYRPFSDEAPATLTLAPGYIALVGPNNAGKSSLLRFFYEFRQLFSATMTPGGGLEALLKGGDVPVQVLGVSDATSVFHEGNDRDLTVGIAFPGFDPPATKPPTPIIRAVTLTVRRRDLRVTMTMETDAAGRGSPNPNLAVEGNLIVAGTTALPVASMRQFAGATSLFADTVYLSAFRNVLRLEGNEVYDMRVGRALVHQWRDLKLGENNRQRRLATRIEEDLAATFSMRTLEINPSADNSTFRLTIDRSPYSIEEVGAGFVQFLATLLNVGLRSPALILIDEPEQNLHPSLQLEFVTRLGQYATHGVLFATHALGLARSVGDRVFTVQRHESGKRSVVRPYETTRGLAELAGELSYAGYHDMGFKTILLVEGTTDLRAIQPWLRMLKKAHSTVLVPLGGASMIRDGIDQELLELGRLSEHVFAIVDSDRTAAGGKPKKEALAFQTACKKANINCLVLERAGTENYFTERALKRAVGPSAVALPPYEKHNAASRAWSKADHGKIAAEMTLDELANTDLGDFLNALPA